MSDSPTATPQPKQRLEWLDALRGFTMILVVAFHVSQMGFVQPVKTSSSLQFLLLFRMPLFFFVSGFLAYKAGQLWDGATLRRMVGKKMRVQLVPTVVFFLFTTAVVGKDFWNDVVAGLHLSHKNGYWFTIALLWMFLIYYPFCYLESKLRVRPWVPIVVLLLLSFAAYETCYLPRWFSWASGYRGVRNAFLDDTTLVLTMQHFPFFLYGNIVRRYWDQSLRLMDSPWLYPVMVVVVIFSTLDVVKWHTMKMEYTIIPTTLSKFILLTMVFMYFRHYQQYVTRFTIVGNVLQYIGRRTLDIYLIHYLFLPNLPTVGTFFKHYQRNFAIDTTLSVVVALVVIGFCCITSNVLRVSPFFRKWLFGR